MRPLGEKQPLGHIGKSKPAAQLSGHPVIRFGQGALEKDGSISLTPRLSGVASGSRSFLTVSTVFSVFAGPFGTSLDAACAPPEAGYGTNSMRRPTRSTPHSTAAFTMVEIALSLAVIGFALVAS